MPDFDADTADEGHGLLLRAYDALKDEPVAALLNESTLRWIAAKMASFACGFAAETLTKLREKP